MKVSLDSVEWKEFKISGIFEIVNSKPYHKTSLQKGFTPYITRTSFNNGLECCVKSDGLKINPRNTISLGAENADFFYQELEYITGNKMYYLKNKNINRYTGLFLVKMLQSSIKNCGFGYGKGLTGTRLKNRALLLPVDSKGDPHWRFMEDYMRAIEKEHLEKITAYYNAKLNESNRRSGGFDLVEYKKFIQNQKQLENVKWKEFAIGEIFEIKATLSGIDKNKLNGKKGNYPYITRSDKTNGIDDFIDKQNGYKSNEANVITIGLDTQTAFYQNSIFYTGQNIQILKNDQLNKYNAFFIIVELKKFMEKFNWGGNGATLARLKRGKILLPIDPKGNPNWQFMESYIKDLELKKLKNIKDYYQKKLYKYKNIS
ncbi:restriction endonuclease subunit S [Campylobacter molothri]|uniref:restriction endonuclease subunit S n=1 Tax=Campylobacter molothri TaxID=1032242 RepID=UPI00301BB9C1|nr:restriction endonuclease subunit S [Campylobacter sp. W0067]MBZ7962954.1 restriction endonuclease subunit S [Campylobacter sp. W0049]